MKLYKEDLHKIGNTAYYDESGRFCIICDSKTANIEEILLRNILELFGDYEIKETNDWIEDGEFPDSIQFVTNLPWEEYMKIMY